MATGHISVIVVRDSCSRRVRLHTHLGRTVYYPAHNNAMRVSEQLRAAAPQNLAFTTLGHVFKFPAQAERYVELLNAGVDEDTARRTALEPA